MPEAFAARLCERVLRAAHERAPGAGAAAWSLHEEWRPAPVRARLRRALPARAGFTRRAFDPEVAGRTLAGLAADPGLARTFGLLADDASRALLIDLLAFRVLGPWHVGLPVRPDAFAAAYARVQAGEERIATPAGVPVPLCEWSGRGGPMRAWLHPTQVVALRELRQYAHPRVHVREGDVVVEAGGAWDETALDFADATGPRGRVVSCEPVPENLAMLRRNLALNPELAARVEVVERGLWSEAGASLAYEPRAGTTSLVHDAGPRTAQTTTIDALGSGRIDFVKLDVEGAELAALEGARATLARDRPRLAVSVYHRDEDLAVIPAFLDDLGLGYELYLGHFTPGRSETILFAR